MEEVLSPIQRTSEKESFLTSAIAVVPVTFLDGSSAGFENYIHLRKISFRDLPDWAQNAGFKAASDEFRSYRNTSLSEITERIDGIIDKRYLRNLLVHPVISGLMKQTPENFVRELKNVVHRQLKNLSPSFTQKHFGDLGVLMEQSLAELIAVPNAVERPGHSLTAITEVVGKSKEGSIGALIDFDPSSTRKVGEPARRARAAIANIAVRYCIVADVLERDGVSLEHGRIRELVQATWHLPYVEIAQQKVFSSLAQLARDVAHLSHPLEHVKPHELFGVFGMSGVGLSDVLRVEEQRRANRMQPEVIQLGTVSSTTWIETVAERGKRREALIQAIIESFPQAEPQVIRSLSNVAIKKEISLAELAVRIESSGGDADQLLKALRSVGKVEKRTAVPVEQEAIRPMRATPEIKLEPRAIYYHRENGRNLTEEWLERLDKSVRSNVEKQIDALAHRRVSDRHYRKLVQRAFTTGDSNVSELKCDNLRIYFRFLPGDRVVFLHHGHKDTQDRDAVTAFKRATEYNGFDSETPVDLKMHQLKNSRAK